MGIAEVIFSLLFLVAGIVLEIYSFESLRESRQFTRLATTKIDTILPGQVRLKGTVHPATDVLLKAPYSLKECVYYGFEKAVKKESDSGTHWSAVDGGRQFRDFRIDDGSGQALVRLSEAVDLSLWQQFHKVEGGLRYTESRIDPGDEVTVIGIAEASEEGIAISFATAGDSLSLITHYDGSTKSLWWAHL